MGIKWYLTMVSTDFFGLVLFNNFVNNLDKIKEQLLN
jgi:hypothetical protein